MCNLLSRLQHIYFWINLSYGSQSSHIMICCTWVMCGSYLLSTCVAIEEFRSGLLLDNFSPSSKQDLSKWSVSLAWSIFGNCNSNKQSSIINKQTNEKCIEIIRTYLQINMRFKKYFSQDGHPSKNQAMLNTT